MVVTASNLQADVNSVINSRGQSVRFKYFTVSGATANYDDDVALAVSGSDSWVSGFVQFPNAGRASYGAMLQEEGLVKNADRVMYVAGTVQTDGFWRVGIGSANPPSEEYAPIENGIIVPPLINEGVIYKKIYLRKLSTGSFEGEY